MHPEEGESGKQVEAMTDKSLACKEAEIAKSGVSVFQSDHIEVHDENVGPMNGNGTSHHEDPIIDVEDVGEVPVEEGEVLTDKNGVNGELNECVNSSIPRMEVSLEDGELLDNMEPLVIQGLAEDLEVSASLPEDVTEKKNLGEGGMLCSGMEVNTGFEKSEADGTVVKPSKKSSVKPSKSLKQSVKAIKSPKPTKPSEKKMKASRSKSPKISGNKSLKPSKFSHRITVREFIESPGNDSEVYGDDDEDDVDIDDEEDELPLSHLPLKQGKSPVVMDFDLPESVDEEQLSVAKSPARRGRPPHSKLDHVKDNETTESEKNDSEPAPRRSSRPRQTPQKYNSFIDSCVTASLVEESPSLNKSDQGYATAVRSVQGRRSFKKSRNMSALNVSDHNESSPWEEYKILTPSSGVLSPHTSVLNKRKADDENDEHQEKETKKKCLEGSDLEGSFSSQTSSFFSIVTSPVMMLKGKWRGSSVSCSTPFKKEEIVKESQTENVPLMVSGNEKNVTLKSSGNEENTTLKVSGNEENIILKVSGNEEEIADAVPSTVVPEKVPDDTPQGRSWCTVM